MKKIIGRYAILAAVTALVGGAFLAGCGGGDTPDDNAAPVGKKKAPATGDDTGK